MLKLNNLCNFFSSDSTFKYPDVDHRKPRVPPHTERPQPGAKSTRNFVSTNAMKNVLTVPKEPCPRYVDRPTGSAFDLEVSYEYMQLGLADWLIQVEFPVIGGLVGLSITVVIISNL